MTSRFRLSSLAFLFILIFSLIPFSQVEAKPDTHVVQDFRKFVASVVNGEAGQLRGVYVPTLIAFPVVQQPTGFAGYVSEEENVVTQFGIAAEVGNVGLLAHNYLAGQSFTSLQKDDVIFLVYGDGSVETFVVTEISKYQALDPYSPYSEFKNLDTNITSTALDLFNQIYRGERHLVLQTCIENNGNSSWGRLFITAQPISVDIMDFNNNDVKDVSESNDWNNK